MRKTTVYLLAILVLTLGAAAAFAGVSPGKAPPVARTYSAALINLVVAATATDICVLKGSATKTIQVQRITVSGYQATGGTASIALIKRSTANTGGTTGTADGIPHDSLSAAASVAFIGYTANPTLGTLVGLLDAQLVFFGATTAAGDLYVWTPGKDPSQGIVLRGTAQSVAVNLNGSTLTGGYLNCTATWIEYP